jgi:hypothetical protein
MIVICLFLNILCVAMLRELLICNYKIAYYETRLKNRKVDISHVESIGLLEIINDKPIS